MRHPLPALLLALGLVLSGCSGSSDDEGAAAKPKVPEVVAPALGQCVAKEVGDGQDVAPDFTTVVPCTEPHAYEVIGVLPVPAQLLDTTSAEAGLARRTELARVGPQATPRARRLQARLWPACDEALRVATGVDRFVFRGKAATALRVTPLARNAGPWLNLAPAKLWSRHPVAVCSVRYSGGTPKGAAWGPVTPVTSADARPVISHWMTPRFPQPHRICRLLRKDRPAPCAAPHGVEYLWTVDFKAAFGQGFLRGADLAALQQDDYETAVSLCRGLYRQTGNRAPAGMRVNYRFDPRTDDPDARRLQLSCVLQSASGKDDQTGFRSLR